MTILGCLLLAVTGCPCVAHEMKERATLRGHTATVAGVAFSSDGKLLATASADRTIKIWDSQTGILMRTLVGHEGEVSSVGFSSDAKTLASGAWDSTIKLWEVRTGSLKNTLDNDPADKTPLQTVLFSPVSGILASGDWGSGAPAKLWDPSTGRFRVLAAHDAKAASLAFSPDGKRLVVGGDNPGVISLWEVESGKLLWRINRHKHVVTSVAFSPDGQTIASGSRDRTVRLWTAETGTSKRLLTAEKDVLCVALSPDGKTLAVSGEGRLLRIYDPQTGNVTQTLATDADAVDCVAWAPDGRTLASAEGKTVKLRQASSAR